MCYSALGPVFLHPLTCDADSSALGQFRVDPNKVSRRTDARGDSEVQAVRLLSPLLDHGQL
jgi:hypothetical protein